MGQRIGEPQSGASSKGCGLRHEVLSPMETLAQSVSTMAPSTTPVATIPLVCALSLNGTWLAYVLATAAIFLVAWCAGNLYPVPEGPYGKLPYIYLAYLAAGMAWFFIGTRQARAVETQPEA